LIKDDNVILPEWIAYHYQVLPLRRLILAIDPYSLTSPECIVESFRREIGLNTTMWTDGDYMYEGTLAYRKFPSTNATDQRKYQFYQWRQQVFFTKCLRQLREEGASYTLFLDTDEFLTFNHLGKREEEPYACSLIRRSGNRTQEIECIQEYRKRWRDGTDLRSQLPSVNNGERTIAHAIHQYDWMHTLWEGKPCATFARVNFGPLESTRKQVSRQVPKMTTTLHFDPMTFVTMRYRKHGPKQNPKPGKSIVNATAYNGIRPVGNPHRILDNDCIPNDPVVRHSETPLRVHHYTGSLEMFTSRPGDVHRTKKVCIPGKRGCIIFHDDDVFFHVVLCLPIGKEFLYRTDGVKYKWEDDTIRGWLQGFVDQVGKKRAWDLTQGLRNWAIANDKHAKERQVMKETNGHNIPAENNKQCEMENRDSNKSR